MNAAVGYCSQHIPPEWIAAHGLRPVRIVPSMVENTPIEESEGLCDFMRGFFNSIETNEVDAVLSTTVCDQMRRGFDLFSSERTKPVHLFNQPALWKRSSHLKLFRYELQKLTPFFKKLGGIPPTNEMLKESMLYYEKKRIDELHRRNKRVSPEKHSIGIGLIGGPITKNEQKLLNKIMAKGTHILFDSTEYSCENAPIRYDRRALLESAFDHMTQQWFETNHAIYQRPNTKFYRWLQKKIRETNPRALILNRWIWCDFWSGETERIRTFSPVPVLILDSNHNEATERNRTRILAFLESLQQEVSPF